MQTAIIVGGGALGSALFRELAQRGVATTLVATPKGGASWHSFSWVNAAAPTPEHYRSLRVQGALRHLLYSVPRGVAQFDGALSWDGDGHAEPVQGSNLIESVTEAAARMGDLGHQVELIDAAGAAELEPTVPAASFGDRPVLWSADEGWVDLPGLIGELRADALAASGTLVTGTVEALLTETPSQSVQGVRLASGELLRADRVIVAAGSGSAQLLRQAGFELPTEHSHGLIIRTRPLATAAPRRILRGPSVSIRPEPGNRLVLHSSATDPAHDAPLPPTDALLPAAHQLLRDAESLLDLAQPLEIDSIDVGIRPLSRDHLPVVGDVPGNTGLYALTSHSGATVCLVLAELAAREIVNTTRSPLLSAYRPERFCAPIAA